jgi:hypothetical protein
MWLTFFLMSANNDPLMAGDVLTPWDVARIRSVSSAVMSPDGKHVAYLLLVPRDPWAPRVGGAKYEDGPPWSELHVVNLTEHRSLPFITGEVNIEDIAWTPDGRSISFLAKRAGDKNTSLYSIPVDGGEARRILMHDTDISGYSWNPDGKHVALLAEDATPKKKKERREECFSAEVFEEDLTYTRVWIAAPDHSEIKPRKLDLEARYQPFAGRGRWQTCVVIATTPLIDTTSTCEPRLDRRLLRRQRFAERQPRQLGAVAGARRRTWPCSLPSSLGPAEVASCRQPPGRRWKYATSIGHVSTMFWQSGDFVMFIGDRNCDDAGRRRSTFPSES